MMDNKINDQDNQSFEPRHTEEEDMGKVAEHRMDELLQEYKESEPIREPRPELEQPRDKYEDKTPMEKVTHVIRDAMYEGARKVGLIDGQATEDPHKAEREAAHETQRQTNSDSLTDTGRNERNTTSDVGAKRTMDIEQID